MTAAQASLPEQVKGYFKSFVPNLGQEDAVRQNLLEALYRGDIDSYALRLILAVLLLEPRNLQAQICRLRSLYEEWQRRYAGRDFLIEEILGSN